MGPDFWTRQFAQFILSLASHGAAVFVSTLGIAVLGLGPIGRAVAAVQALGWVAVTGSALRDRLPADERAVAEVRTHRRNAYGALGLYGGLSALALWLQRSVAALTAGTWLFWLVLSFRTARPRGRS